KMFQPEAGSWLKDAPVETQKHQTIGWVLVGGILSIVLLLLFGFAIGHAPVAGLQAQVRQKAIQAASLQHQLAVLIQNDRHCWTYTRDIQTIRRLTDSGQF